MRSEESHQSGTDLLLWDALHEHVKSVTGLELNVLVFYISLFDKCLSY